MCLDDKCPLMAHDIIAQPNDWNPKQKFEEVLHLGHTVNKDLVETSFHTLHKNYLMQHPELNDAGRIC